ncbi:MAG TPA: hypothetical protein VH206_22435 [Xanthobacteraceae bacterium]|nr:hypothetical protein [Xanthobacteraceae bacterium]
MEALRTDLVTLRAAIFAVEWQFWVVLGCSLLVTAAVKYNMPLWYGGSDHSDYYWYGRFLLGDSYRGYAAPANWRTPGMGLFYILSGTVLFDTWRGFIALSAAFSVAMPVLYYLMVRPHSRNFALIAGLAMIASMIPYLYANLAGSDHIYYFFHSLLLLLCVRYFQKRVQRSPALLIAIAVTAAWTCTLRPVGAMIFWIFIVLAVVIRRRDWRRIAAACGVYIVLMGGWILWDRAYGTDNGITVGLGYQQLADFSTSAERRLGEAYFSPQGLIHAASDDATTGYASSQALRSLLRSYLTAHQRDWGRPSLFTPPSLFADYAAKPNAAENLLQAILNDRNYLYFSFIIRTAEETLGHDAGLALIHNVAGEHGTTGLYGVLRNFLIHPTQLLFGVTPNLSGRAALAFLYFAKTRDSEQETGGLWNIPDPLLSPELGPGNALILGTFKRFITDYPQYWPKPFADRFRGNPDALYRLVLQGDTYADSINLEGFLYQSVNWYLGPAITGRAYVSAFLEVLAHYPKLAGLFYDNALHLTLGRRLGNATLGFDRATLDRMSDPNTETLVQVTEDLPKGLAKELTPVIVADELMKNAAALNMLVYLIAPVFVFTLIASLPFLRDPLVFGPVLFLIADYGYEVAAIAVFGMGGAQRYDANFYMLPLIISCMLLGQSASRWRNRRNLAADQPSIPRTAT